jgi:Zn-dependent peptidase ImmA (M78 family)/plasmid maintenance system antidote protein VapI
MTVNPEMVVLARESRGLTQAELADALGVSQAKVSKYENGLLSVADEDLDRMAKVLRYSPDFFHQADRVYGLGSSMLFHRKRQSVPIFEQRRIQAEINVLRMQVERLLRGAEVESENRLEPIDIQAYDGDARRVAQIVRAAWRLPMGPVPNVTAAIEGAGGVVLLCDFGTCGVDAAHLWVPGMPALFFMNSRVPGDRHRFNLAHELGHAVMHQFPVGDIEAEANAFAAEFLMPSREIGPQLEGMTIQKAARLKTHWKVSMQALIFQARDLGKITDRQYRSLFTRLSALGYRKAEPIPIPVEQPSIVSQLVAIHKEAFGYSDQELGRLLFTKNPQFFRDLDVAPHQFGRQSVSPSCQNH